MNRADITLPSRGGAYLLILGVIIGMLAAGLAIPFVFGTPLSTGTTGSTAAVGPLDTSPLSSTPTGGGGAAPGVAAPGGRSPGVTPSGVPSAGGGSGSSSSGGLGLAGPTGPGAPAAPGGPTLTATDRGVTANTVTIAFTIADLGGVSRLGYGVPGFDPKTQQANDSVFVDYVNANGGILGRKLAPLYFKYDPLNEQSEQAACLSATQDHAIFAAIDSGGALSFSAQLCFTQQNHTPLLDIGTFGTPTDLYRQALGNLFTVEASGVRALGNAAYLLVSHNVLKGKHIGIIDRDFPGTVQTVKDGMIAVLKQLGYPVVYRSDISMDDGTAAAQIPEAVQQMQAHGADVVMLLTDFITGTDFVQAADKRAYRPLYITSDFESETNDTSVQAMPSSFQAVGVTASRVGEWRAGIPEAPADAACRKIFTAATHTTPARGDMAYAGVAEACGLVEVLARGARGAGTTLTRANYTTALQQIGSIAYPYFGGFSYRPGKRDGTDPVRLITYRQSCTCWVPASDFVPPRY
ncbi:MAG: ABC transporter substrate-binding protein [Acidimicrobiales bacterium]